MVVFVCLCYQLYLRLLYCNCIHHPLDPREIQPLTVFITKWGCYMYLRLPQGYLASGDAYTRRYDELIKEVPRKIKIFDDCLLYDHTIEQAFYHVWDYLQLYANNGIALNANKFRFCCKTQCSSQHFLLTQQVIEMTYLHDIIQRNNS